MQDKYIMKMVNNLPVLRAAAGLTQVQLAMKLGVSRQTIVAIENKKNTLTWSLYLAIVLIFQQYDNSEKLLEKLNLYDNIFILEI